MASRDREVVVDNEAYTYYEYVQDGFESRKLYKKSGELIEKIHHSIDDLPCYTDSLTMEWKYFGKYHREGDKPALILPRSQYYYKHGKLHRLLGPAKFWTFGALVDEPEWYIDGVFIPLDSILEYGCDPYNISDNEAILLKKQIKRKPDFRWGSG